MNCLDHAELITDEEYKAINNILHPTSEDEAEYLDEDNISTHTIEETTTSEQEEPEHIANATDSEEEEQEPTEEEEQEPTEEKEPIDDNQLNINIITKKTEGATHNATQLLNGDYEANKFIDYLLFENAQRRKNGAKFS